MKRGSIKRYLCQPVFNAFWLVLLPFGLFSYGLVAFLIERPVIDGGHIAVASIWLVLFGILAFSAWYLFWPEHHPDLKALARYGNVKVLLPQIEDELADVSQAVCIGAMPRSLWLTRGELGEAAIWITSSWLVRMANSATQMQFFRLDSLIFAYPEGNKVILADCYGVRLEVTGTESGRARLLAEILTRVPWALSRFDPVLEKTWKEKRQEIIAEVDQRRLAFQQDKPMPKVDA